VEAVSINNTCAVFAESEIVSLLATGGTTSHYSEKKKSRP
jgi:activator of 2-hydroxyglutaryl-CoA dehydratase